MKMWIAVLRLSTYAIPAKVEYVRSIVTAMAGNAFFPSPPISLDDVSTEATALETAYQAALTGGKTETAAMYAKDFELSVMVNLLAAYVGYEANNDHENGDAIIFSAEMDVKGFTNTGRQFKVFNTPFAGRVILRTLSAGRASYEWQYTLAPSDPAGWVETENTLQATTVIEGLEQGQQTFFRVRATTKSGAGPWQGPIDIYIT